MQRGGACYRFALGIEERDGLAGVNQRAGEMFVCIGQATQASQRSLPPSDYMCPPAGNLMRFINPSPTSRLEGYNADVVLIIVGPFEHDIDEDDFAAPQPVIFETLKRQADKCIHERTSLRYAAAASSTASTIGR